MGYLQPPKLRHRKPGGPAVNWAIVLAALAVLSGAAVVGLSFLWMMVAMVPEGMAEWLFPRVRHVAVCVVLPFSTLSIVAALFGLWQLRKRDPDDGWRGQDRGLAIFSIVVSAVCALLVALSYW